MVLVLPNELEMRAKYQMLFNHVDVGEFEKAKEFAYAQD